MEKRTKIIIGVVSTLLVSIVVYAIVKAQSGSGAVTSSVPEFDADTQIDTGAIDTSTIVNTNAPIQKINPYAPTPASENPPPIPGGIGYYKNKPRMGA